MPSLHTLHRAAIFEIVLNRPDKRNAIHWPMLTELGDAIEQAERAAGARVVIIRGEGPGFSAGIDLAAFADLGETFGEGWAARMVNVTGAFQSVLTKVERCALPTIALLHGYALGLGFELALACDLRLAAHGAKIGLPETRLGLIPDVGGTTRLTRLVGPARAKELILTGRTVSDLAQVEQWGLLNAVVAPEELLSCAEALAAEIAQAAPLAVSYAKRVVDGCADLDRGLQFEAWAQNHLMHSEDFKNGARAFLRKTPVQWQGR
jgi:enoyl-CoA hydratase/carnithine racemase